MEPRQFATATAISYSVRSVRAAEACQSLSSGRGQAWQPSGRRILEPDYVQTRESTAAALILPWNRQLYIFPPHTLIPPSWRDYRHRPALEIVLSS